MASAVVLRDDFDGAGLRRLGRLGTSVQIRESPYQPSKLHPQLPSYSLPGSTRLYFAQMTR